MAVAQSAPRCRPAPRPRPGVVRSLLAVQAENPSQAAWAVACRTRHTDPADLEALLDHGTVVRTHVLRPTWHFVATEDIGWLLELTAPRIRPTHRPAAGRDPRIGRRRPRPCDLRRSRRPDGPADQNRQQLAERLVGQGVEPRGQMLMLLLALLELDRLICSGRPREGAHTYATSPSRVPWSRTLNSDEALAELALRYFTGHGPATERDLAYWATLTLTDVRRGLDQVRDLLASFVHDGRTFWHAPGDPPARAGAPRGHLLQICWTSSIAATRTAGWCSTARASCPAAATAIGMALVDAQMVAPDETHHRTPRTFEITPYAESLTPSERTSVEQAAARYADFLGLEHDLRV